MKVIIENEMILCYNHLEKLQIIYLFKIKDYMYMTEKEKIIKEI